MGISGGTGGKNPPTNTADTRDAGSTPRLGRFPGKGNGNPLQYSCPGNPMDGGAWRATVHGVTKSRTRLSNWTATARIPEPTHPSIRTEKTYYLPTPLTTVSSLYVAGTFINENLTVSWGRLYLEQWSIGEKEICFMSVSQVISGHFQRRSSVPQLSTAWSTTSFERWHVLISHSCTGASWTFSQPLRLFFFFTYQAAAYLERSQNQLCQS